MISRLSPCGPLLTPERGDFGGQLPARVRRSALACHGPDTMALSSRGADLAVRLRGSAPTVDPAIQFCTCSDHYLNLTALPFRMGRGACLGPISRQAGLLRYPLFTPLGRPFGRIFTTCPILATSMRMVLKDRDGLVNTLLRCIQLNLDPRLRINRQGRAGVLPHPEAQD